MAAATVITRLLSVVMPRVSNNNNGEGRKEDEEETRERERGGIGR